MGGRYENTKHDEKKANQSHCATSSLWLTLIEILNVSHTRNIKTCSHSEVYAGCSGIPQKNTQKKYPTRPRFYEPSPTFFLYWHSFVWYTSNTIKCWSNYSSCASTLNFFFSIFFFLRGVSSKSPALSLHWEGREAVNWYFTVGCKLCSCYVWNRGPIIQKLRV